MFDDARNLPWLDCINSILDKLSTRISALRLENEDKTGVVPRMQEVLQKRFDSCAGFQVIELEEGVAHFKVIRSVYRPGERARVHHIDVQNKTCSCGKWQDFQSPCVDAMAYLRQECNMSLHEVMQSHISPYFTYEHELKMLTKNINPVILDQLETDGKTKPPKNSGKRFAGRPKQKRIRKRSKFANPGNSTIVCSKCGVRGHNKRSCTTVSNANETVDEEQYEEDQDDNPLLDLS